MSELRSFTPALVVLLALLVVAGVLVWRLSAFGKEIDEVAHRKR
jgi:hypothetical protein